MFKKHVKHHAKFMFSESLDVAMFALLERFGRPSWLTTAKKLQKLENLIPKSVNFWFVFGPDSELPGLFLKK